ncbi:unnamed protein product [Moneuplotes crassus]|uniref:Transmembrane protein n=1 Tax=Euplotes crassus TaxID=5936 RepID=A0AAD1XLY4_EUPCR|nr:unnamed protein product [Moneuplotes crassus]
MLCTNLTKQHVILKQASLHIVGSRSFCVNNYSRVKDYTSSKEFKKKPKKNVNQIAHDKEASSSFKLRENYKSIRNAMEGPSFKETKKILKYEQDQKPHYPISKEKEEQHVQEFIKAKREAILSEEDFEKLHNSNQRILIWEIDRLVVRSVFRSLTYLKILNLLSCLYVIKGGILLATTGIPLFFLGGIGGLAFLHASLRNDIRKYSQDTLLGVFYLTESRQFETLYFSKKRTQAFEIEPSDVALTSSLKIMRDITQVRDNPKKKQKLEAQLEQADSIYVDTKNNRPWRTVDRGTWYNQPLWLYLLTKYNKGDIKRSL